MSRVAGTTVCLLAYLCCFAIFCVLVAGVASHSPFEFGQNLGWLTTPEAVNLFLIPLLISLVMGIFTFNLLFYNLKDSDLVATTLFVMTVTTVLLVMAFSTGQIDQFLAGFRSNR